MQVKCSHLHFDQEAKGFIHDASLNPTFILLALASWASWLKYYYNYYYYYYNYYYYYYNYYNYNYYYYFIISFIFAYLLSSARTARA